MNLPNKLTLWRIILVPFFVAALLIPFPLHTIVALVLFIAASITDMLDGRIARKRNLITDFGKFADPLADKILVLAALLCFVQNGWCDCIAVIIVLFREFTVTSIRLIAAAKGEVIAANIWGKVKTVTQMVAIITILVFRAAYDIIVPLLPQLPDSRNQSVAISRRRDSDLDFHGFRHHLGRDLRQAKLPFHFGKVTIGCDSIV